MLDTFSSISSSLLARCPVADLLLSRQWVSHTFRRIMERRRWSSLTKYGQFIFPQVYNTGTVTVTQNSTTVTGVGTAFTAAMVGLQFRPTATVPIYTINSVNVGAQTLTLDFPYGAATQTTLGFEIFSAYPIVPTDFHSFITAVDPANNWRLWINMLSQADLDAIDPRRSYAGSYPYLILFHDYASPDLMTALNLSGPPLPRMEVWPHVKVNKVVPFMYETRWTDLEDANASLPRYIRGDVLLEGALAQAAAWPGPEGRPNPMFNLNLSIYHKTEFERMVNELERQDDEIWEQNINYSDWFLFPYAPFPLTASYIQTHAI